MEEIEKKYKELRKNIVTILEALENYDNSVIEDFKKLPDLKKFEIEEYIYSMNINEINQLKFLLKIRELNQYYDTGLEYIRYVERLKISCKKLNILGTYLTTKTGDLFFENGTRRDLINSIETNIDTLRDTILKNYNKLEKE